MTARRVQAPTQNHAQLRIPDFQQACADILANVRQLAEKPAHFGEDWAAFRQHARTEALAASRSYLQSQGEPLPSSDGGSLIVTGHQPELAHPGVWLKNFEVSRLAEAVNGASLNLIVDNDTLKTASIALPHWSGADLAQVQWRRIPFDRDIGETPYEDRLIQSPQMWADFPSQVQECTANWGYTPLLASDWPKTADLACPIGEQFSRIRRHRERRWGLQNWELPVSWLARTSCFQRFAHWIGHDPNFRAVYNQAVRDYRQKYRLRSLNHPVPDLQEHGTAWEAPFWLRTATGPRQRWFVEPGTTAFPADLRPRALTLTLYTRYFLADYFVHGIGGAKYDEVTNAIIERYFRAKPPAFQVVSGTLRLPLPQSAHQTEGVETETRRLREMLWNPQRFLDLTAEDLKTRLFWLQQLPQNQAGRRRQARELREITLRWRARLESLIDQQQEQVKKAEEWAKATAVLGRRDYAWVLFPETVLGDFVQRRG